MLGAIWGATGPPAYLALDASGVEEREVGGGAGGRGEVRLAGCLCEGPALVAFTTPVLRRPAQVKAHEHAAALTGITRRLQLGLATLDGFLTMANLRTQLVGATRGCCTVLQDRS